MKSLGGEMKPMHNFGEHPQLENVLYKKLPITRKIFAREYGYQSLQNTWYRCTDSSVN
jgi:hypothetical protein